MKNSSHNSSSSDDREEENWTLKVLNNRYITIKKLGSGAYASVWLTYDVLGSTYCAAKISNRDDYQTCLKEAKVYESYLSKR